MHGGRLRGSMHGIMHGSMHGGRLRGRLRQFVAWRTAARCTPQGSWLAVLSSGGRCWARGNHPRAQNRGFCALLPSETLIFRPFEHKIEVFVRFWPQKPSFSGLPSTKMGFLCSGRRRMALESVTAETLTVNVAFLQITEHAYKIQTPHNQIINF